MELIQVTDEHGVVVFYFETESDGDPFRSVTADRTVQGMKHAGQAVVSVCKDVVGEIRAGLAELAPDTVELELGVKLSVEGGVAIVSKAGAEGSITVKAIWNRGQG